MASVRGTVSGAWKATKWTARNLTPIGKNGRLVWTVGTVAALSMTALAPATAFASAAQGITASSGVMDYAASGLSLAWAGAGNAAGIGMGVAHEMPGIYDQVMAGAAGGMS